MITRRDLVFSDWRIEKANERLEKHFGSYIYASKRMPDSKSVANVYWNDKWYIEYLYEASDKEIAKYELVFYRRGSLQERIESGSLD